MRQVRQPVPSHCLSLAGEFAVASELCRRGIYAQLTLGNLKSTDLLLDADGGGLLRVQVKAKQKREWPAFKGVRGPHSVVVLVDYEGKGLNDRPDFYVLTEADWRSYVQAELVDSGKVADGQVTIGDELIPVWKDKYMGVVLRAAHVKQHQEQWEKIHRLLALPQ